MDAPDPPLALIIKVDAQIARGRAHRLFHEALLSTSPYVPEAVSHELAEKRIGRWLSGEETGVMFDFPHDRTALTVGIHRVHSQPRLRLNIEESSQYIWSVLTVRQDRLPVDDPGINRLAFFIDRCIDVFDVLQPEWGAIDGFKELGFRSTTNPQTTDHWIMLFGKNASTTIDELRARGYEIHERGWGGTIAIQPRLLPASMKNVLKKARTDQIPTKMLTLSSVSAQASPPPQETEDDSPNLEEDHPEPPILEAAHLAAGINLTTHPQRDHLLHTLTPTQGPLKARLQAASETVGPVQVIQDPTPIAIPPRPQLRAFLTADRRDLVLGVLVAQSTARNNEGLTEVHPNHVHTALDLARHALQARGIPGEPTIHLVWTGMPLEEA